MRTAGRSWLWLTAVFLCACLLATSSVAAEDATPIELTTVQQYLSVVNPRGTPILLVIFDPTNREQVEQVWTPLLGQLAAFLTKLSIGVAYAKADSEIGQALLSMGGISGSKNALLFFNAIMTPVGDQEGSYAKLPQHYVGSVNSERIMRWALESISSETVERVENDAGLLHLLSEFPGFPELARVLYFTDADDVGPVYKIASQYFIGDAVFGVVQKPFSTNEKSALAKRYNVTTLPAMLVLSPDPDHEGSDLVQPLKKVGGSSTFEGLVSALLEALPQSAHRVLAEAQRTNDTSALLRVTQRRQYVIKQMAFNHAKLLEKLQLDELDVPTMPASQDQWDALCGELQPKFSCLVAVASDAGETEAVARQLHDAALRLFKVFPDLNPLMVHRVVLDAQKSSALVRFFNAGNGGFPDIFLSIHRPGSGLVYFNFIGAFTPDRIAHFFSVKLTAASGGTPYKAAEMPPLFATMASGDTDDDGGDL